MSITILLATQDGMWESPGIDREQLKKPEQLSTSGNEKGFDTCSWVLRRDLAPWPDLAAFTPCEIWEDGTVIFEGYVQETPMRKDPDDVLLTVSGRGDQYSMDDDASIETQWVHSNLTEWVDSRSLLTTQLGNVYFSDPQVNVGEGSIAFSMANGMVFPAGGRCGVTLDFKKPELGPLHVIADLLSSANDASLLWYIRSSNDEDPTLAVDSEDPVSGIGVIAANAVGGSLSRRRRYLHLILYRGTGVTYAAEVWAKAQRIICFKEWQLESSRSSVLRSSQVLIDSLPYAPRLSQDTSGIEQSSFFWPDFHPSEPRTFREIADAANAAHRWQLKVGVGRRLLFRPQRTVPKYAATSRVFEDNSANSGEEVYNKCVVVGTGPDGVALRVERYTAQLPGVAAEPVSSPSLPNPSAATDATGLTVLAGATPTRTTTVGEYDSSPGGFKVASSSKIEMAFTGTFRKGVPYTLTVRARAATTGRMQFSMGTVTDFSGQQFFLLGSFATYAITWVPMADVTTAKLTLYVIGAGFFDTFTLSVARPTLVDRRGFVRSKRLDVPATLTELIGNQFGDAFLTSHMKTPMRGSASFAPGDLTDYLSGQLVHPRELPKDGGELVHFVDIVDPDTGALGRDGMIASAAYDPETEVAGVQLDNMRDNMEALIARYAVVMGRG